MTNKHSNHSYKALLINKEFASFQGVKKINQWVLVFIIFLSIGCISLALQIYGSLKDRMNNPFTNWVNLPVLADYRDSIKTMEDNILKDDIKDKYKLKSIVEYNQNLRPVLHKNLESSTYKFIRSMDFEEDLFNKFLDKSNVLYLKKQNGAKFQLCDIFISEKMYNDFGMEWNLQKDLRIILEYRNSTLLLNVVGVVKDIPNFADMVCSPQMMNLMNEPIDKTKFYRTGELSEIDLLTNISLDNIPDDILSDNLIQSKISESYLLYGNQEIYKTKLYFKSFVKFDQIDVIKKKLEELNKSSKVLECIEWECLEASKYFERPQYLAFNFNQLDKVRSFKDELIQKFGITLDISEVEDKENFALVSKLAIIAILSIMTLGIFCFIIFIYFLVKSHLDKMKQNIGTFMAFGLSNRIIENVYVYILTKLLVISSLIALVILFILNAIYFIFIQYNLLDLINFVVIIILFLYLAIGYVMIRILLKKLCSNTPGDLIYSRV